MKIFISLIFMALFGIPVISQPISKEYLESLRHSHDLNLPAWGPDKRSIWIDSGSEEK